MKKKMSDKHKLMAYVLSTDADLNRDKNITQDDIANLFGVSQPTVAQAVKEAKLRLRISELEQELSQAKGEVMQLEGIDVLQLPENVDSQYKRKP
jgi:predicted transcriptional regulator